MISFLLAVTLIPVILPGLLSLQKTFVQWEMKEKLEKEKLHTLKLPAAQVQWAIIGNECIIDGRMFDVKTSREEGNMLVLEGLYDDEETALEKAIAHTSAPEDEAMAFCIQQATGMTAIEPQNPVLPFPPTMPASPRAAKGADKLVSISLLSFSPPPEYV